MGGKDPDVMIEEKCAITTRVSPSFLRIGHVDIFARRVSVTKRDLYSIPKSTQNLPTHIRKRLVHIHKNPKKETDDANTKEDLCNPCIIPINATRDLHISNRDLNKSKRDLYTFSHVCLYQKKPTYNIQKIPTHNTQKRPTYIQKRPIYIKKRSTFFYVCLYQKRPTHSGPTETLIYPAETYTCQKKTFTHVFTCVYQKRPGHNTQKRP